MQLIGLLLTVIIICVVFAWYSPSTTTTPGVEENTTTYSEAINAAKEVVEKTNEGGGTQVEVYAGISVGDWSTVLDLPEKKLTDKKKEKVIFLTALTKLNLSDNQFTGI